MFFSATNFSQVIFVESRGICVSLSNRSNLTTPHTHSPSLREIPTLESLGFRFLSRIERIKQFFLEGIRHDQPSPRRLRPRPRCASDCAFACMSTIRISRKTMGQAYGAAKIPPIGRDMPSACNGCNKLKHNNLHINRRGAILCARLTNPPPRCSTPHKCFNCFK